MKETRTYALRLPRSLKDAVERLSREERTCVGSVRNGERALSASEHTALRAGVFKA